MKSVKELGFAERKHVQLFLLLDDVVHLVAQVDSDRLRDVAQALNDKPAMNPAHRFRLDSTAAYLKDEIDRRVDDLTREREYEDDCPF